MFSRKDFRLGFGQARRAGADDLLQVRNGIITPRVGNRNLQHVARRGVRNQQRFAVEMANPIRSQGHLLDLNLALPILANHACVRPAPRPGNLRRSLSPAAASIIMMAARGSELFCDTGRLERTEVLVP